MARRRIVIMTAALIAFQVALSGCSKRDHNADGMMNSAQIDTTIGHAPAGVRIKVEVLNGSKVHGAARMATFLLRDRGYDVVATGNAGAMQQATVVLDRSNHPEWAKLIAKAIGGKAAERPDTSAYLDATVVLGTDWTPPPMAFHP